MNRKGHRAKAVDDVERLRQVRRQIEREHPSLDALYDWLKALDRERQTTVGTGRKAKPTVRQSSPKPRKSA